MKDKYKEAKDHNRKQTGGERKTSPFYEELDSVLSCCDVVTLKHVEESGPSTKSPKEGTTSKGKDAKLDSKKGKGPMKRSSTSAKASSPARNEGDEDDDEEFAQFAVSKNRQRDRKDRKKSRKRKSSSDDEEDSPFNKQMEKLGEQGDKLNGKLESMGKNQSQQLQMLNQFMNNFMQVMQTKSQKE